MGLLSPHSSASSMLPMKVTASVLVGVLSFGWNPLCAADETTNPVPEATPPAGTSKFRDPDDGQIDLSRFLATPRNFLPVPLIVTEPAVGYGGGLAGMFLRPRKDAGSEGFARPNISIVGGIATENGTWAAFAGDRSEEHTSELQSLA